MKENKDLKEDIDSFKTIVSEYEFKLNTASTVKSDTSLLEENSLLKKRINDLQNNQSKTEAIRIPSTTDKDDYIKKLENEIGELKKTKNVSKAAFQSIDCTHQIDSLKQSIILIFSRQKLDNSKALSEIEKWKKKYLECVESKQSF